MLKSKYAQKNLSNSSNSRELSGNLRKMKFMQRGHEAEIREEARKEREAMLKETQWVANEAAANSVVLTEDTSLVRNQLGRRSFANFNQEIEKLHENELRRQRQERERAHQNVPKKPKEQKQEDEEDTSAVDVTAAEMAAQFVKNKKRGLAVSAETVTQPSKKQRTGSTNSTPPVVHPVD